MYALIFLVLISGKTPNTMDSVMFFENEDKCYENMEWFRDTALKSGQKSSIKKNESNEVYLHTQVNNNHELYAYCKSIFTMKKQ